MKNSKGHVGGKSIDYGVFFFNLPGIDWVQEQGKGRADEDFLDLIQDCFLTQFVDKPTRESAVLELRLSNDPNMVVEVEVGEHLGSSNHNIVCAKTVEG